MNGVASPHIIYGLIDPRTQELRYVGYTSYQEKRYRQHIRLSQLKHSTHKNYWIKSLKTAGVNPEMIVLEYYPTAEELPMAEVEMIEYYKWLGCQLVNSTEGGELLKHTPETRAKIGAAHKGKTISAEHRARQSAALTGKPLPIETRIKMSAAHLGKKQPPRTDEHKANLSASLMSRECTGATRAKISASSRGSLNHNYGKKLSPETRAKMSESRKRRVPTCTMNWDTISRIRELYDQGKRYRELQEMFGKSRATICRIITRKYYDDGKKPAKR